MESKTPSKSAFGWQFWLLVSLVSLLGTIVILLTRPRPSWRPCIVGLKQIDGAVQQWALEFKKLPTDTYSLSDTTLLAYIKGSVLPVCPQGGRYSPGTNVSDPPRCNIPGHTL